MIHHHKMKISQEEAETMKIKKQNKLSLRDRENSLGIVKKGSYIILKY